MSHTFGVIQGLIWIDLVSSNINFVQITDVKLLITGTCIEEQSMNINNHNGIKQAGRAKK